MRSKGPGRGVEALGGLVLFGVVFMSLAGLGLARKYKVSETDGAERTVAKPVRYDLVDGQTLSYKVKCIDKMKTGESTRLDFALDGCVEIIVKGHKDSGECMLDFSTSVVSFDSKDERLRGLAVDKDERLRVAMLLNAEEGGVEFDKEEAARLMKASAIGQLHARLFQAVAVVFPMLPKRWSGSPFKGEEDSWTFSYDCVGPIVIRGKQKVGDEDNGVIVEAVSEFAEGAVRSGYLKRTLHQKRNKVLSLSESVLEVSLVPEGQRKER